MALATRLRFLSLRVGLLLEARLNSEASCLARSMRGLWRGWAGMTSPQEMSEPRGSEVWYLTCADGSDVSIVLTKSSSAG
jgi:hypothetical protein